MDKLFDKVGVTLEDRAAYIDSLKGYCTEPDEIIFGNNMVYPFDVSEVSNVEIPDGVESIRLSGMQNVNEIILPIASSASRRWLLHTIPLLKRSIFPQSFFYQLGRVL